MSFDVIKKSCDKWLESYFKDKGTFNKKIYESMYYSILVGGKRIRPILMMLTYQMYKDDLMEILPVACAMEMIHTYSLIHDDLPCMDDDDLRRGKPTNHKVFGEAIAVLAGDALLNEAMNVMFEYCMGKDNNAISACKCISNAAGADGMIGGQLVDILSEGKEISMEELYYMHDKKTGAIISASVLSGAYLAGAPVSDIEKLKEFGKKLGLAFQIKDDILDIIGDEKTLGKGTHKDQKCSKSNFISMFGIEKCEEMCEKLTDECINLIDSIPKDGSYLKNLTIFLLKRNC
jgi:geranylgeranyl diphosphate synthase, type II